MHAWRERAGLNKKYSIYGSIEIETHFGMARGAKQK